MENDDLKEFGKMLALMRTEKGMNKSQLAKAARLLPGQVADMEEGRRNYTMGSLSMYLGALGMTLTDLLKPEKRGPGRPRKEDQGLPLPALEWKDNPVGGMVAVETIPDWTVRHFLADSGAWRTVNSVQYEVQSGMGLDSLEKYRRSVMQS